MEKSYKELMNDITKLATHVPHLQGHDRSRKHRNSLFPSHYRRPSLRSRPLPPPTTLRVGYIFEFNLIRRCGSLRLFPLCHKQIVELHLYLHHQVYSIPLSFPYYRYTQVVFEVVGCQVKTGIVD